MLGSYNMIMRIAEGLVLAVTALAPDHSSAKFMRFGRGQRHTLHDIINESGTLDRRVPTVWFHCASLGEYGIARPIISQLKRSVPCNVVLTFFSPTGYEALTHRMHTKDSPDRVWYLPLDTRDNCVKFLDAVRPDCAVFMVSEYWHNYLDLLTERDIPALLVSAIIREDGPFFKWYGHLYRKSIKTFRSVYALDTGSVRRLERLGVEKAILNGDPLFDNAVLVSRTPWDNPVIEHFTAGRDTFVAGSIHPGQDLEMTVSVANSNPDIPFIIVPHEISNSILRDIEKGLRGGSIRLSECNAHTDFTGIQSLIVDSVGSLAYLYRYGRWAYVGGGFSRFLHSVVEPVVYGLPVAFGPQIRRKVTPRELEELGIGTRVENAAQLDKWLKNLRTDRSRLKLIRTRARDYVERNSGATPRVVNGIKEVLCGKK